MEKTRSDVERVICVEELSISLESHLFLFHLNFCLSCRSFLQISKGQCKLGCCLGLSWVPAYLVYIVFFASMSTGQSVCQSGSVCFL